MKIAITLLSVSLGLFEIRAAEPLTRIMFGSCIRQDRPAPILPKIAVDEPELFIFLGDNIYGDTDDMKVLWAKYQQLAKLPGFAELRADSQIMATWDDHDYGKNDAGADYAMREESQRRFLNFWGSRKGSTVASGMESTIHGRSVPRGKGCRSSCWIRGSSAEL